MSILTHIFTHIQFHEHHTLSSYTLIIHSVEPPVFMCVFLQEHILCEFLSKRIFLQIHTGFPININGEATVVTDYSADRWVRICV